MILSMIAALARNGVIGRDNQLPWHLPNDLKFFKATTMGKPIIMGRKTFESIGRPLPGRSNIVVSRDPNLLHEGVQVAGSVDEAVKLAEKIALRDGADEVMVIGGAQLYEHYLPQADKLYLTRVYAVIEGDAYFPVFDEKEWLEVSRENFQASGDNPFDYSFVIMSRKSSVDDDRSV